MIKKDSRKDRIVKTLSEVEEWALDRWPSNGWLDLYIDGVKGIAAANEDLFDLGMEEVARSLLAARRGEPGLANDHMLVGFSRIVISYILAISSLKSTDRVVVGSLDRVTHALLGAISSGQHDLCRPLYEALTEGIAFGYGVHDGHNPPIGTTLRYAAFGLSIISDWLGTPLDLDKHALPRDPAWGQLVAHWREPDLEKFLPALLLACDTHVERIAVTEREANALSKDFEFNSVFLAVHPTEILAVLRLRDLLGLTNPIAIDHPLMQTPYAAITSRPGEVTERDELLERYLAAVRRRDPQVLPQGW